MAPIAWRNLWRNPRRTCLTAGAIAFGVSLIGPFIALQVGQYAAMVDGGTSLLTGHLQIQREGYADDPKLERTVPAASALKKRIEALPGVVGVGRRGVAFALVSSGERSYAAQVMGVEPDDERALVRVPKLVRSGRYLESGDEVVIGSVLAHNLGVTVGDELTILGTARDGSVAALGLRIVGEFDSESTELDRVVVQVPYDVFAASFGLDDEAHALVVAAESADAADPLARRIAAVVDSKLRVLGWRELMPELEQMIELDRTSGVFLYGLIVVMVTFSVVNTFVMTVFERTREFGMLLALGMRPRALVGLLQLEAFCLVALGIGVGSLIAALLIVWVARVGFPLPEDAAAMLEQLYLPSRMYPAISAVALLTAPIAMFVAVQLAALFPALRVRRLAIVNALRAT